MMVFLYLFIEFFKIGLFAIGGGPATIPFLMDLTDRYDWYTKEDVINMLAVSESTPGPIGINMATYAGFKAAGFLGGLVATLSLVLPSLIVVILIAKLLNNFSKNPFVRSAFSTIRPLVTDLSPLLFSEFSRPLSLLLLTEAGNFLLFRLYFAQLSSLL